MEILYIDALLYKKKYKNYNTITVNGDHRSSL